MLKINQIQNELRQLDGGDFQKLGDAYLQAKGYNPINSLGSVIGKNKVKTGTPDTLIPLPNGKYIFVEHTTDSKIVQKIQQDLKKCFDENKTQIPINKIDKIIFCHTSQLNSSNLEAFRTTCQEYNVTFESFGIDSISWDLYDKYPHIAKDFLKVEVDTRQIVEVKEFIADYNKNALTTPIDTHFHSRNIELEQILSELENNNLVIISGKAGVGKTRLVLECCDQFIKVHSDYKFYCIRYRGLDIYDDIQCYFSPPRNYIIFVDDANRNNNFRHFIDLLNDQREDQKIKVIATVRDYAVDKITKIAKTYNSFSNLIEILPLKEEQIKTIVKQKYNINNPLYLDRIVGISQGNPRLALMAAKVATEKQTIHSLIDISSLYDQYYESIREDLDKLENQNLLKIVSMIAFFKAIDLSNKEIMTIIETVLQISLSEFSSNLCELSKIELVDIYENKSVKISDQILATYLFYLSFFKDKIIDFSILLDHVFPRFRSLLIDSINPVINTFDFDKVKDVLRPGFNKLWDQYQSDENNNELLELIKILYFVDTTKVLIYVKQSIEKLESESVEISSLETNPNNNIISSPLLEILTLFKGAALTDFSIALELMFKYLEKRPKSIGWISKCLQDNFSFNKDSYILNYKVEHSIIDLLIKRINQGENLLFIRLFIQVGEHYLKTHFTNSAMITRNTISFVTFDLPNRQELIELREKIWNQLFQLYQQDIYQEEILNILLNYCRFLHESSVTQILEKDALKILDFIQSNLDPNTYYHCFIVNKYSILLERHNISFDEKFDDYFSNETYKLSQILCFNMRDQNPKNFIQTDYKDYKKDKQQKLENFFKDYTLRDYQKLFNEQYCEIYQEQNRNKNDNSYTSSPLTNVLSVLSKRDPELYINVLEYYLELGNQFQLYDCDLVYRLLEILGIKETYKFLEKHDYNLKIRWLFCFYIVLPEEEIPNIDIDKLYQLFRVSQPNDIPNNLYFLLKYQQYNNQIIIQIIKIMLEKNNEPSRFSNF